MAATRTNFANAFETTLTAEMGPTDLEAQVLSTAGAPSSPAYIVIDPDNDERREYILFDGTFGSTTFRTTTTNNRYLSNSGASAGITHSEGAVVRMAPTRQHFEDLHDRIDGRMAASTHTVGQHESMGLATKNEVSGRASDPHGNEAHSTNYATASALDAVDLYSQGKLDKAGGTMQGDLFLHSYKERRTNPTTSPQTVDFAGPAMHTTNRTTATTIAWSNIPSSTSEVRSVTLVFYGGPAVTWPSGTKFVRGAPPEMSGETWLTAVATGGVVTVLTSGTEIS